MQTETDRTAGKVDWPPWAERTDAAARERTSKFSVTLAKAIGDIETELEDRLGVVNWRLSTAAPHRKSDGRPYADASPDDPAVVVRWTTGDEDYAVACDRYTSLRDNCREIGLWIEETRKKEARPVETGQSEFATARLPSGDEDAVIATRPPHEVLEVAPDAGEKVIRAAARSKKKEHHPDRGGDQAEFQAVLEAEEAMVDG